MSFTADTDQLKKVKKLTDKKRFALVSRGTLNDLAFEGREIAMNQIMPKVFTLRNSYITRGMRVKKATSSNIGRQISQLGSSNKGLALQEKSGKVLKPRIPTTESRISKNKKRVISTRFRFNRLGDMPGPENISGSSNGRAVGLMQKLKREKYKKPFKIFGHKKMRPGVYRFVGGGKNPRVRMIKDFSKEKVMIKKRPFLMPSAKIAIKKRNQLFDKNWRRYQNV